MEFEIGRTIGGYEFLEVLSSSKTGVSYKVRNTLVHRLEELKVLPSDFQQDQARSDRFSREVKIRARLSHPNIVAFYNTMQLEGRLVMTTELVEGETLDQRLKMGRLPLAEAVEYIGQGLAALVYAHAYGVVHRDLSPSHMIVSDDGKLKLTDFGLAKTYADPSLTQTGAIMGSVYYASPEQVKGSSRLDERTDIYSTGTSLYEAVTGKKLFESKSQFDTMRAHIDQVPAPPSEGNSELPAELDEVILKALAKNPDERFQTAKQFRDALLAVRFPAAGAEQAPAAPAPEDPKQEAAPEQQAPPAEPSQAEADAAQPPVPAFPEESQGSRPSQSSLSQSSVNQSVNEDEPPEPVFTAEEELPLPAAVSAVVPADPPEPAVSREVEPPILAVVAEQPAAVISEEPPEPDVVREAPAAAAAEPSEARVAAQSPPAAAAQSPSLDATMFAPVRRPSAPAKKAETSKGLPKIPPQARAHRPSAPARGSDLVLIGAITFIGLMFLFFAFLTLVR